MREEGYYWVKQYGVDWEVANFFDGKWFLIGVDSDYKCDDDYFFEINETRIKNPGEL